MRDIQQIDLDGLLALDSSATLVLTVNKRYARRLLGQLAAHMQTGYSSLAIPDIVPLGAWLSQVSDHLCFVPGHTPAGHELDNFTALLLWQQAISRCEEEGYFLDLSQAARSAAEADQLIDEWQIQVAPEEQTLDYQHFLSWRSAYREQLQAMDLDDTNTGIARVLTAIGQGAFVPECRHVVLLGFHEYSPRLRELLGALENHGVGIWQLHRDQEQAGQVYRVAAFNTEDEWRQAAAWARAHLQADPQRRVAIVAAGLESQVPLVHRVMHRALSPAGQAPYAYNVAAARPLAEWSFASAALAWMKALAVLLTKGRAEPDLLGQALLAGACVAEESEQAARIGLDLRWRKQQVLSLSAPQFQQQLDDYLPELAAAWRQAWTYLSEQNRYQSSGAWGRHWRHVLQLLGFPGGVTVDSAGFQTLEALDKAFQHLGSQAPAYGEISLLYSQQIYAQLLRETPFQPQRDPAARLDVLGFLEAEGGRWDAVWVLGLSDTVLPAAVRPNPLIPAPALRRAQAPRSTPERELAWARLLRSALLCTAPSVYFSYPQTEGEQVLRPSPLIAMFEPLPTVPEIDDAADTPVVSLEPWSDPSGPVLSPGEPIRGGVAVLDAQARNPLWAFVKYRLHAAQMPDYARLEDMNSRGLFLHKTMELLWPKLGSRQALSHALAQGQLEPLVEYALDQAANTELAHYGETLRLLEVQRARQIVRDSLQLELSRPDFQVEQIEEGLSWQRGALSLSLRLDRLDSLPDQGLVLFDYKTGSGSFRLRQEWLRERPINLQLPFYAILLQEQGQSVVALSLARLHARAVEFVGLGLEELELPGLLPLPEPWSWPRLQQHWHQSIYALADEFARGDAQNQFFTADDLRYCDVLPFLRLHDQFEDSDEAAQ